MIPSEPASIREATAADADAIRKIVERARDDGGLAPSSDPHAMFMERAMLLEAAASRLAVVNGGVVGFAHAQAKIVYVVPPYRRQGIGRALVEVCLGIMAAEGQDELILGAMPTDDAAEAFLRATGFTPHSKLELPADR
jgi:ribosomal protein S18 acetylase RimI-like enzyme